MSANSLILLTDIISDYNNYCPKEYEKVGENIKQFSSVSEKTFFTKRVSLKPLTLSLGQSAYHVHLHYSMLSPFDN